MDCSPPGSSVHGILQARILESVAIPFSRGSSQLRDWTRVSYIADRFFTTEPPGERGQRAMLKEATEMHSRKPRPWGVLRTKDPVLGVCSVLFNKMGFLEFLFVFGGAVFPLLHWLFSSCCEWELLFVAVCWLLMQVAPCVRHGLWVSGLSRCSTQSQ